MKKMLVASYALCVYAAAIMLGGCGGSVSPSYQTLRASDGSRAQSIASAASVLNASCQAQKSFAYVHHAQKFKVPKCVSSIYVDAMGAAGGGCCSVGGSGGEVSATIPVTPRETLMVTVGGLGGFGGRSGWHGGFNGGGAGAQSKKFEPGGGGGGASDVRQSGNTLTDRVVVAGGGGGDAGGVAGGTGGGLPQGGSGAAPVCDLPPSSTPVAGSGGTQSAGGSGGAGSNGGSLGVGGAGVGFCEFFGEGTQHPSYNSSGGGGGYYGGGGGGDGGSGGGGSGYAEPSATNVSSQNGVNSGNGAVLICWGFSDGKCGSHNVK
jgi:hypothetical protein